MHSLIFKSHIRCFQTHVDIDIFSCFGMQNLCPKFVHTFHISSLVHMIHVPRITYISSTITSFQVRASKTASLQVDKLLYMKDTVGFQSSKYLSFIFNKIFQSAVPFYEFCAAKQLLRSPSAQNNTT
jgi:hypothetical protein